MPDTAWFWQSYSRVVVWTINGAHGISILVPAGVGDMDDFPYYRDSLRFAQVTRWDEFLDAFVNGL